MILVVGDSFTYGSELSNHKLAWPYLLGEDVINLAKPGVGNEFIVKKTILGQSKYKPDLVIVAWTSCGRREFADDLGVYDIWPNASNKKFNNSNLGFRLPLIDYITKYNNDLHEYRTWLRQVVLLQSHLQIKNQRYLFCSAYDNQHRFGKFYKTCQDYYDLIDDSKFIGWPNDGMVEWAYKTPRGPGGHPLEEGHKRIADEISKHL